MRLKSQQMLAKKITHFTNLNSLDIIKNILPQHSQKHVSGWCQKKNICTEPFLDALKLHFWSTWTANVSNLRSNIFVPETLKAFIWRWQNSSPQGNRCLGLVGKCLRFFYLIEIYKCLTAFRISILPSMALNVLWLSALLLMLFFVAFFTYSIAFVYSDFT